MGALSMLKWFGVLIFVAGAAGVALTPILSIFSPAFAFLSIFAIVFGGVLIFSVLIYEWYCESTTTRGWLASRRGFRAG